MVIEDPTWTKQRPSEPCQHGNGDACECQLPVYDDLFVVPVEFANDGLTRHLVVRVQEACDGGMRAYIDPKTGEVVGSAGCNTFAEDAVRLCDVLLKPDSRGLTVYPSERAVSDEEAQEAGYALDRVVHAASRAFDELVYVFWLCPEPDRGLMHLNNFMVDIRSYVYHCCSQMSRLNKGVDDLGIDLSTHAALQAMHDVAFIPLNLINGRLKQAFEGDYFVHDMDYHARGLIWHLWEMHEHAREVRERGCESLSMHNLMAGTPSDVAEAYVPAGANLHRSARTDLLDHLPEFPPCWCWICRGEWGNLT